MNLIDGKKISQDMLGRIAAETALLTEERSRAPHLAAILVGDNPASESYVRSKVKACEQVGFRSTLLRYPADTTEEFLLGVIDMLNDDDGVDGILVQLPLPKQISEVAVIEAISASKDVDGFHPINIGRMAKNLAAPLPATPGGILELLRASGIETKGKSCVVIGRSNIVGSPMSILMSRDAYPGNATVTLTHRHTPNLAEITRKADIIVVAVGKPGMLSGDMIKEGAVIIDVGINRVEDASNPKGYRIVGDVDFASVAPKASHITPVPGGVGPMTIAQLLQNTLELYKSHS